MGELLMSVHVNFLNRRPIQIPVEALDEQGFYLPKALREEVIQNNMLQKEGLRFLTTSKEKYVVYMTKNGGPYVEGPVLGSGAFGVVSLAQDLKTGRWHCFKMMKSGRVLEEIEIDILKQEGMYRFSEKSHAEGNDVFCSELIHGVNLSALIKENRKTKTLSFEQVIALSLSLFEAYESLHRKGYVHRDIKPENVIVDMAQLKCVAIDFGTVMKMGIQRDRTGTLLYMPLEAFDLNSLVMTKYSRDIYGMGLTAASLVSSAMNVPEGVAFPKEAKERKNYIQNIQKVVNAYTKKKVPEYLFFEMLSGIVLGAKDKKYQKNNQLSKEQVRFFNVLYDMTGVEEKRPTLNVILQQLRKLRFEMIKKYQEEAMSKKKSKKKIESAEDMKQVMYQKFLKDLLTLRDEVKTQLFLVDAMDAFLLKMLDTQEKNKPTLEEVCDYYDALKNTLEAKKQLLQEMKKTDEVEEKLEHEIKTVQAIEQVPSRSRLFFKKVQKAINRRF